MTKGITKGKECCSLWGRISNIFEYEFFKKNPQKNRSSDNILTGVRNLRDSVNEMKKKYEKVPEDKEVSWLSVKDFKRYLEDLSKIPDAMSAQYIETINTMEEKARKLRNKAIGYISVGLVIATTLFAGISYYTNSYLAQYHVTKKSSELIEQSGILTMEIKKYTKQMELVREEYLKEKERGDKLSERVGNLESEATKLADNVSSVIGITTEIADKLNGLIEKYTKEYPEIQLKQSELNEGLKRLDANFSEMDKSIKELNRGLSEEERSKEAELKEEFDERLEKLLNLRYPD